MSARESISFITRAEAADRIVTQDLWSADHQRTPSPAGVEPEAVDPALFRRITCVDLFVNRSCVECGCHAALFITAGRFVVLCSSCTVRRIAEYRVRETGNPEPGWIGILDGEARREAQRQAREEESQLTVTLDDIWKCARCGRPIREDQARYCHAPGENGSPPYCRACFRALMTEEGGRP